MQVALLCVLPAANLAQTSLADFVAPAFAIDVLPLTHHHASGRLPSLPITRTSARKEDLSLVEQMGDPRKALACFALSLSGTSLAST